MGFRKKTVKKNKSFSFVFSKGESGAESKNIHNAKKPEKKTTKAKKKITKNV